MHIRKISVAKYPYPFKQGNYYPYPIRIYMRIVDISKISIRGYISAHLCSELTLPD